MPELRVDLVNAQYDLRDADFPVVVIVAGDDRIAANEVVNRLNEWLDTRFIRTHVMGERSEAEPPGRSSGGCGSRCRPRAGSR